MRRISSFLLLAGLLAACSGGGGGGGGSLAGPPYVEAGLVIYDSVQVQGAPVSEALRRDLERAGELAPQDLPLGYQVLVKAFWRSVSGAEGYRVYLREEGVDPQEIASLSSSETEFTLADVLPSFNIEEGLDYEVGVAAVRQGQTGSVTWSWPLRALGAVSLTAPAQNSSQPARPNFIWSNARGNPSAAELSVIDGSGQVVVSGFWTSSPLLSSATPAQDLPNGDYRWVVINGSSSQAVQDARTEQYFPSGYMVLSLPALIPFTVGSSGGGGGGGGGGGDFDIELIFGPNTTDAHKQVFEAAASRWEEVITGDLSDVEFEKPAGACGEDEPAYSGVVDDIAIYAEIAPIDGPGNILGYAGPCAVRNGGLTGYGIMRFDSEDMASLEADGTFSGVILHEMGHVFGIGTLWDDFSLLNYAGSDCFAADAIAFTGSSATSEWAALGGTGDLPVENEYGRGTKCGHWDEETFDNELLTGFAEAGGVPMPMSRMTIGSLEDLGYVVNKGAADDYQIPACRPNCIRAEERLNIAEHELLLAPQFVIESDGSLTPLEAQPPQRHLP